MISVVVPVYKNATTLGELCARLGNALEGAGGCEILLVVDASPDDSAQVAQEIAAQHSTVKVIVLAKNVGQTRAILTGLAHASGDIAVVMDGDLQDSPESIPALLEQLRDPNVTIVYATR